MIKPQIQQQLDTLPLSSGVYKYYDLQGNLLYIGKALNLRSRVLSYFRETHTDRPHIIPMIPLIDRIEITETENDIEALVLESALIKEHQPKYNVLQKDDKSYAWILITTKDQFPTVKIVRSVEKGEFNRGRLFGPYPSGMAVKRVFKYLRKLYPFCTCNNPKEVCLYFHLGMCPGPHQGYVTREQYMEGISEIIKFLEGKRKKHVSDLQKEMQEYSRNMEFEKAAQLRDKISDLEYLGQKINFSYYDTESNYVKRRENSMLRELENIRKQTGLESLERVECYDISNIQGQMAYGSMVVAINGMPDRAHYRIFKIKTVEGSDDPQMLKEVLLRRLNRIGNTPTDDSLNVAPDLFLIDGGKAQLGVLKSVIPDGFSLMGISKGKHLKRAGSKKHDEFWIRRGDVIMPITIDNHNIFSSLRDEAHRFALRHHRKSRKFNQKKSILDSIPGIGPKRRKELIKAFGSVDGLKQAEMSKIAEVLGNMSIAKTVYEFLRKAD